MALNSVVTRGGVEIGRAQAMQAAPPASSPRSAMNPILIKPSGERHSQVIVLGRPYARRRRPRLPGRSRTSCVPVVAGALAGLRARYDVVVCEGAGSPAEINLRAARRRRTWASRARPACR